MRAADGVNDAWLVELLSPAFTDWLARSPEDFDWELADGVLCASRGGHLDARVRAHPDLLRRRPHRDHGARGVPRGGRLGQAPSEAPCAPKRKADDQLVDSILARTTFDHPPADVAESRPQFRRLVVRHPSTYFISLFMTLAFMLVANVIGGGIFGLLLNLPSPGRAVLIFELCLFAIIGFFVLRSQINGTSRKLAVEGFWREYARTRGLRLEDPSAFAATHAKATCRARRPG